MYRNWKVLTQKRTDQRKIVGEAKIEVDEAEEDLQDTPPVGTKLRVRVG